jgi:CheY-like chemotaxis protein
LWSAPLANLLGGEAASRPQRRGAARAAFTAPEARALGVDDHPNKHKVARGLLQPYQMTVDLAESGAEAVKMVKDNHYDVIFMDHMMPGMDGIQATERIRSIPEGRRVPIIALTANAMSGVKEMFISHGMNDFISKPIDSARLEDALLAWLPEAKRLPAGAPPEEGAAPAGDGEGSAALGGAAGEGAEPAPGALEALGLPPQERPAPADDSAPLFDPAHSLAQLGGSQSLQKVVLSLYLKSSRDIVEKMRALGASGSAECASLAHSLKDASLNIGSKRAGEAAAALEEAAESGGGEAASAQRAGFISLMERLFGEMADFLGEEGAGGAGAGGPAPAGGAAAGDPAPAEKAASEGPGASGGAKTEGEAPSGKDAAEGGAPAGAAEAAQPLEGPGGSGEADRGGKGAGAPGAGPEAGQIGAEPEAGQIGGSEPFFDPEASLGQLGGDEELMAEVLEMYIDSTPDILANLKKFSGESLADYALAAHSLKGSSLNIGAARVGEMAAAMEKAAKGGDREAVSGGTQPLIEAAEALIGEMRGYLRKNGRAAES